MIQIQRSFQVRTNGEKAPPQAMREALEALQVEIRELQNEFQSDSHR